MKFNQYDYQQTQERKTAESVSVAALVRVMEFDPRKMTVDVTPISKHLENGEYQSQPPVLAVPVAVTRSGGYIVRPWVNAGDVGLVVYSDHDIDNAIEKGAETEPTTERNHSTTDAIYIGGVIAGDYTVPDSFTPNALVFGSEDGASTITIGPKGIDIVTNGEINITASKVNIN